MKIIRTVSALLYYRAFGVVDILIHKHPKFGIWMGPGGKIEDNETEWETLWREVFEETGLDISESINQGELDYQRQRFRSPNSTIDIACDDGSRLIDYTYYIEVDRRIRFQDLKHEPNKESMIWWNFDHRFNDQIDNIPMFADTRQQIQEVYSLAKRDY